MLIKDLRPNSKGISLLARVLSIGPPKEVRGKYGDPRHVAVAFLEDGTGRIAMSLWNEQIGRVAAGSMIQVENAHISLVHGEMRLNVGPYGTLSCGPATMGLPPCPGPAPPATTERVIVREIVKVPCRYCGTLNVNTDLRCSSCGGPNR